MTNPSPIDPRGMSGSGSGSAQLSFADDEADASPGPGARPSLPGSSGTLQEVSERMGRMEKSQKETLQQLRVLDERLKRMEGGRPSISGSGVNESNVNGSSVNENINESSLAVESKPLGGTPLLCPVFPCPASIAPTAPTTAPLTAPSDLPRWSYPGFSSQQDMPPPFPMPGNEPPGGYRRFSPTFPPTGNFFTGPASPYAMYSSPPPDMAFPGPGFSSVSAPDAQKRLTFPGQEGTDEEPGKKSGVGYSFSSFHELRQSILARKESKKESKLPCCKDDDIPSCSGCEDLITKMEDRKRKLRQQKIAARKAAVEAAKEAFRSTAGGHNFVACMPQCSSDATFRPPRYTSPYGRTRPPPQLTACVPTNITKPIKGRNRGFGRERSRSGGRRGSGSGSGSGARGRSPMLVPEPNCPSSTGSGCPFPTPACGLPSISAVTGGLPDPSLKCARCPGLPDEIKAEMRRSRSRRRKKK